MQIDQTFIDEVRRAIHKIDSVRGGGSVTVYNTPHGISISAKEPAIPAYDDGAGGGLVLVKVGANIAAGKYRGTIYSADSISDSGSGTLSMPDGLGEADSPDCILLVTQEDGSNADIKGTAPAAAQRVALNSWALAAVLGTASDANQTLVAVMISPIGDMASADAKTINPSGTTADTATWSSNGDGKPLKITKQIRTVYDSTAGQLIAFTREESYDAFGRLCNVSAETKVVVMSSC